MAVTTALSIMSAVSASEQLKANAKSQQDMFEYNARQERREADAEQAEANEQARRQRLENERLQSAQRAAYGKSGAALYSGSPLAVLGETAAMQEMEVQDTHRGGAMAYNRRQAAANSFAYQGKVAGAGYKSARTGVYLSLGKTLIQDTSSFAFGVMSGYKAGR